MGLDEGRPSITLSALGYRAAVRSVVLFTCLADAAAFLDSNRIF